MWWNSIGIHPTTSVFPLFFLFFYFSYISGKDLRYNKSIECRLRNVMKLNVWEFSMCNIFYINVKWMVTILFSCCRHQRSEGAGWLGHDPSCRSRWHRGGESVLSSCSSHWLCITHLWSAWGCWIHKATPVLHECMESLGNWPIITQEIGMAIFIQDYF